MGMYVNKCNTFKLYLTSFVIWCIQLNMFVSVFKIAIVVVAIGLHSALHGKWKVWVTFIENVSKILTEITLVYIVGFCVVFISYKLENILKYSYYVLYDRRRFNLFIFKTFFTRITHSYVKCKEHIFTTFANDMHKCFE